MEDYNKKAEDFLKETNTIFKVEFLKNGFHFEDDKEPRDIYLITLKRGERVYKFNFGQSINKSLNSEYREQIKKFKNRENKFFPSAYDVLACLTKSEVGSFKDFCGDYGYDEDSRKAEKTYKAVLEEWKNIKMLYSDEEILKLQEIQ